MEIGNPNIPSLENLPSFENNNVPLLIATIVVIGLAIYQKQKTNQYQKKTLIKNSFCTANQSAKTN